MSFKQSWQRLNEASEWFLWSGIFRLKGRAAVCFHSLAVVAIIAHMYFHTSRAIYAIGSYSIVLVIALVREIKLQQDQIHRQ